MAERVISTTQDNTHTHHLSTSSSSSTAAAAAEIPETAPTTTHTTQSSNSNIAIPDNTSSADLFRSGTYVVQVPKDQIYRIPPPENALIVERHRNPAGNGKGGGRSGCRCCICFVFAFLAIVVVVLGIVAACLHIFVRPKDPNFKINKFIVNNDFSQSQSHRHHHQQRHRTDYDLKLKVENSNWVLGYISFENGGRASIFHKTQLLASSGKFPTFRQEQGSSRVVALSFPNGKSLKDQYLIGEGKKSKKKSKVRHVDLTLNMKLPAHMKTGFFGNRDVEFVVTCRFTVNKMGKNSRILSQECQSQEQS